MSGAKLLKVLQTYSTCKIEYCFYHDTKLTECSFVVLQVKVLLSGNVVS